MITPERARLSAALNELVDLLVELVAAGVAEQLRPHLGELVALRGAAPAPSEPTQRTGAPPDLLTIAEAATLLNVPENTIRWWTYRAKVLPHVSIGAGPRKLCRIRRADLDAFVDEGARGRAHAEAASAPRSGARVVKRPAPKANRSRAPETLARRCAECTELQPLRTFARRDGGVDPRCQSCRRRDSFGPPARIDAPSNVVDLPEALRASRRSIE